MLNGMREEVGVDKDGVWWDEGGVILEEERRGNLRTERLSGDINAGKSLLHYISRTTSLPWAFRLASISALDLFFFLQTECELAGR